MLVVAVVEQHPVLLLRGEGDGHVGGGLHGERLQLHVGGVVEEAEAGHVLAPLAAVAGGALAHVVRAAGLVQADTVLAVVLLAGRGLRVQLRHHRLDLAELPRELGRTLARVLVDAVATRAAVLAHVRGAVVHVGGAVLAHVAQHAVARVVGEVVLARAAVLAGVLPVGPRVAEGDLLLAVSPLEARAAAALVLAHLVHAGPVVLAAVLHAVVHVDLAADSLEAGGTVAPAPTRLSFQIYRAQRDCNDLTCPFKQITRRET